jgi:ribA/ribD-fused uncharacterized protein
MSIKITESTTGEPLTLFYTGPFSQWHSSPFMYQNIRFKTAEHFMMWCKNLVFDGPLEIQILQSKHPAEAKKLGRLVPNFDPVVWDKVAEGLVVVGNYNKFKQHPDLADILLSTQGTLVECSPTDKIWGIGLDIDDPRCLDVENWPGQNKLGKCLTKVRTLLKAEKKGTS